MPAIQTEIKEQVLFLMQEKEQAAEGSKIPKNNILIDYFQTTCEKSEQWLKSNPQKENTDYELADQIFRKIIDEVERNA